jgi:uncharacterized coiled-coil DUF342 family protein
LNTLDDRVTKLEREMKDVYRVAATRLPAGVSHEEVEVVRVELRTQATTLNALRISHNEHARETRDGFADVRSKIADVRTKVADVRTEVAQVRSEVADVRTELRESIAKVHDRLRAHDKSLEALRLTQIEQGQEMREGFTTMREGFTTVNLGMAQMTALLTIAIKKDEDGD